MVSRYAWALIVVAAALGVAPANAQRGVGGWSDILPELNKADIEIAKKKSRGELIGKPIGTVLVWNNPKSGNSGTVQLVSNFKWQGYQCRKVVHAFHVSKKQRTTHRSQNWEIVLCDVKGEWKWPVPPKRL